MEAHSHHSEKAEKNPEVFSSAQVRFFLRTFDFNANLADHTLYHQVTILENYYARVGCIPSGALLKKLALMLLKVENSIPRGEEEGFPFCADVY